VSVPGMEMQGVGRRNSEFRSSGVQGRIADPNPELRTPNA
jgi:hypothetical protein